MLLSTEAAGEGRNLQFCHVMVNFDLPWNPMQIEQRQIRTARVALGQHRPRRALDLRMPEFAAARCPACDAGEPLVATRERLGCRACAAVSAAASA